MRWRKLLSARPITNGQMAVFLVKAFDIPCLP